ncbi:prepilin peptidase [Blautia coccoides]|uniref:prepilin peptidase n=1 Tax=Blautia producta TaxID=33035 RepID=UPI002149EA4A|nr:prepilin peptidase [Blautia coccoides]MCR1989768.1 prepilin peptidase [Blautia coccoides]
MIIFEIIILTAASISDIRSREVPIKLTVLSNAVRIIYLAVSKNRQVLLESLISAAAVFAVMFLIAYYGNLGGADCLLGETIGFYLGLYGLYAVIIATLLSMPQAAYKSFKHDKSPYPFVPYLMAGFLIVLGWQYFTGINIVFFL